MEERDMDKNQLLVDTQEIAIARGNKLIVVQARCLKEIKEGLENDGGSGPALARELMKLLSP